MTDTKKLRKLIKEHGYKLSYIAEKLGISPQWLAKKIDNKRDFTSKEIVILCDILEINDWKERIRIFFTNNVSEI